MTLENSIGHLCYFDLFGQSDENKCEGSEMNGFIHNYARPEQKRKREIFNKLARSQACINMDTRTNKHVLIYTTRENSWCHN